MKSAFIVNLSRGEKVKIDEDELLKVINGIRDGNIIVCKQGIINPSFIISIVQDEERMGKYWGDLQMYKQGLEYYPDRKFKEPEIETLKDIFGEVKEKLQLPEGK